jgi:hypothetical protein
LVGDNTPLTEIIWAGPANTRFPVRRIDQVLYDLVSKASRQIVLVTFTAHRVRHLCALLTQAVERGVELTLIVRKRRPVRRATDEGCFGSTPKRAARQHPHLYTGPLKNGSATRPGAPISCTLSVPLLSMSRSSVAQNLTDDAFNRNMELGMLVREQATVFAIAEHFKELISRGILVEVQKANQQPATA